MEFVSIVLRFWGLVRLGKQYYEAESRTDFAFTLSPLFQKIQSLAHLFLRLFLTSERKSQPSSSDPTAFTAVNPWRSGAQQDITWRGNWLHQPLDQTDREPSRAEVTCSLTPGGFASSGTSWAKGKDDFPPPSSVENRRRQTPAPGA